MERRPTLWYIAFGIIVVLIGALAGLYAYLYSKGSDTSALVSARGLQSPLPAFPGQTGSTAAELAGTSSAATSSSPASNPPELWQVASAPVAGVAFLQQGSSSNLVYADRATGYIYEANASTGSTVRLTNTLHARTYRALFPGDGKVLEESARNDSIQVLAGVFPTLESATGTLPSSLTTVNTDFPPEVRDIAVSANGLLMLSGDAEQGGTLWQSAWNGTGRVKIFSSPISDWRTFYAGGAILVEQPSDGMAGYAYRVGTGGQSLLFGPAQGLTLLPSPGGQAFLFGVSQRGSLSLGLEIGSNDPAPLPVRTVADKCVWMPGPALIALCAAPTSAPAHFLDSWNEGGVHTSDTWWRIDASRGSAEEFFTPDVSLDVIDPIVDRTGKYLAFINNSDQTLWVLRLAQ